MADLVTHLSTVLLPGSLVSHRAVAGVAIGVVLPDALGRVVPMALELAQSAGVGIPDPLVWSFGALHAPAGILLTNATLAQAFVRDQRLEAFLALTLGGALHVLVDLLQFHYGRGYPLLAPFSWQEYEIGIIGSELTVDFALPLLGLTLLFWGIRGAIAWSRRPATPSEDAA